ncbi:hypothetical protein BN59_02326 [Legionella massiliensis]|uniref:Uncharacterized protein n=1 Tax=Legionella massiliensis TaxID=1034943 RepID=A0A078L1X1_9GAMM|nr:hypothetical protein [Legionella massiliensis]CDZ78029.1 hypothetical protein BN59_02326 [Legionella massiliensis]CEE13767.1 hypothetical protein BN1094_02326 [Legionella massiliensis]
MTSDQKSTFTPQLFNQISWTAIFVGTLIGFGLGVLLDLFGLALSLSLFSTANTGAMLIAIGGMVSLLIGLAISMLIAGYATGYLGRPEKPQRHLAIFYGLTTWSLVLLLNALIALPLNQYIASFNATLYPSDTTASNSPGLTIEALPTNIKNNEGITNDAPSPTASPKMLAESTFIIFGLFFIGACFSCFGASKGMRKNHICSIEQK